MPVVVPDLYEDPAELHMKAVFAAASISTKSDDCGCGCGDCGGANLEPPVASHFGSVAPFSEQMILGPINGRRGAVELKAAIHALRTGEVIYLPNEPVFPRSARPVNVKVGVVSSRSRTGRAVQAVGSYLLPGDTTSLRKPVRSAIYQAITPGGGGRRGLIGRIGGEAMERRCPPGFEGGGRFANATFSNCGRQLFALADEIADASRRAGGVARSVGAGVAAPSILRGQRVGAGPYARAPIAISRAAQIPAMSKPVGKLRDAAVEATVSRAGSSTGQFARLVRADGIILNPVSDIARLAKQRNNADMVGAFYISRAASGTNIGGEELKLLGAGVAGIRYVTPGGGELRIDAKKKISASRASGLARRLEELRRNGDDYGSALRALAAEVPEILTYAEKFPNLDNPNELVVIKRGEVQRTVPRWAFHVWLSGDAPGRSKAEQAWVEVDKVATLGTNAELVAKKGKVEKSAKGLAEASSFDRLNALRDSKTVNIGANRTRHTLGDGSDWVMEPSSKREHLGVVVGNDIANALGVTSANSFIAGPASRRTSLTRLPSELKGARVDRDGSIEKAATVDLARVILADYLTNNEGRTPSSLIPITGAGGDVASMSSPRNLMGHIQDPERAVAREAKLDLPAYLKKDGSSAWVKEIIAKREGDKAKIVAMYEDLIKKADAFSWEAYIDRLGINGLTDAERTHLETLRKLWDGRLDQLRSSRKMALRVLGVNL